MSPFRLVEGVLWEAVLGDCSFWHEQDLSTGFLEFECLWASLSDYGYCQMQLSILTSCVSDLIRDRIGKLFEGTRLTILDVLRVLSELELGTGFSLTRRSQNRCHHK